ncbi:MAG: hypothetical protein K9H49_04870 [Bacteroidales bacterium]|nr:hypothetical protein [Bacteroidales bacterium]MCF8389149.1 hypothetical protein [Bacteroidales bacterium]
MKSIVLFLALILSGIFSLGVNAQSKKILREKNIKSLTVNEYFLDENANKPVVESYEAYNDDGDLIELKEFNSSGIIKRWEKYVYNEEGEIIEEQFFDDKGKISRTEKTTYNDGLREEKQFFDAKGRLYKKKVYVYE